MFDLILYDGENIVTLCYIIFIVFRWNCSKYFGNSPSIPETKRPADLPICVYIYIFIFYICIIYRYTYKMYIYILHCMLYYLQISWATA